MRIRAKAAFIAGTGALAAGLGGLGGLTAVSVLAVALAAGTAPAVARQATILIYPQVLRVGDATSQPRTTAECEAAYHVACYEPAQIQQAYNLPPLYRKGIDGAGTTIVIVDSFGSPTIVNDLRVFDEQFGLRAPPSFRIIQPTGAVPPYNPDNGDMADWAVETTLDVEYAHTIAPGASILLVETPVSETEGIAGFPQIVKAEEYVIDHKLGDVISQSFGATEETFPSKASVTALRGAYVDAYRHHVTVLAAVGDKGAAGLGINETTFYLRPAIQWPASDPLVTGVGGTQLHLTANGKHASPDTVWNDTYNTAAQVYAYGTDGPIPLASGGGKSILFSRPPYQDGVQSIVGSSRGIPDISMSAACNGSVDMYSTFVGAPIGWYTECGTSEATPLFAGIVALADQVAGRPLGLINPALYYMSEKKLPGLVAVTSGNNTVSFTQDGHFYTVDGFSARRGYSLVAGVGTVNGALFVPELASLAGR